MKKSVAIGVIVATLTAACLVPALSATAFQEGQGQPQPADMAAMMEKARQFTEPGPNHKILERFIGKWNVETRFFMGAQSSSPEKGVTEAAWLTPGRWVKSETNGTMMGRPVQIFSIIGYDNFKMSYVTTSVSSLDTAMTRTEGDMDPSGKALLTYGTLDEYLTGEHDKMVKYVWRFVSDDKIVLEIHDLPIGEQNTKVVEITYTRQK